MKNGDMSDTLLHSILILVAVAIPLHVVWMILISFMTQTEAIAINLLVIFPTEWMFSYYSVMIERHDFVLLYFKTFMMMLVLLLATVLFSATAVYAFARLEFKGRD